MLAVTDSSFAVPSNYFSVDGGVTHLKPFEIPTQNDPSDWLTRSTAHDAFDAQAPYDYATLSAADAILMNALGFDVNYATVLCFAEGTRFLTERGEVPVENLAVDDRVVLVGGGRRRSSGSAGRRSRL